jgi:hypothetical protein
MMQMWCAGMRRSVLVGVALVSAFWLGARVVGAQPVSDRMTFFVGSIKVIEGPAKLEFFSRSNRLAEAQIKPGGILVPEVSVEESGVLSIGKKRVDLRTGAFLPSRRASECEVRLSNAKGNWVRVDHDLAMVLIPRADSDERLRAMSSRVYSLPSCKELSRELLAGGLLDNFAEFGASRHGWWLVGSDERFVLAHPVKQGWVKLPMPENVGNVLSAKWARDGSFWILANRLNGTALTPALYRTLNLGVSWVAMDVDVRQAPEYWFEVIRELNKSTYFDEAK